jgi:hypothetical protein
MSALDKLCEEVLELGKKATRGPWTANFIPNAIEPFWRNIGLDEEKSLDQDEVDRMLIEHYRWSAVKLAQICQLQAEALKAIEDNPTRSSFREAGDNENNWTRWAKSRSLEAIAKAEEIAGGE